MKLIKISKEIMFLGVYSYAPHVLRCETSPICGGGCSNCVVSNLCGDASLKLRKYESNLFN